MTGIKKTREDPFRELTWGDLAAWTGRKAVEQGKAHQKNGMVQRLNKTESGGLIAWVREEEDLATRVEIEGSELFGQCTCQGEDACEHMVAVVLEYIAHLRQNIFLPSAGANDPRFFLL